MKKRVAIVEEAPPEKRPKLVKEALDNKTENRTPKKVPPSKNILVSKKWSSYARKDLKVPSANSRLLPNVSVENWSEFKKQKKDLKIKRKQSKFGFDVIVKAKQIGEELRRKKLNGGEEKRTQLINQLHSLLKDKRHYPKFILSHDTARLVQWLLKYAPDFVVQEISKELIPVTVDMLQSKYGIFCAKRLLKYGNAATRSQIIDAMLGHSVKLASHALSAPVVEYAYSTWATPQQKQYLIQEFYGDLYKNTKDSNVKHLRDVYKTDASLKTATLGATKANLTRILNKSLLDSGLVQSVLHQFLTECTLEDRAELISQLAQHIVIISNSKDGSRAAMQCIWHGTNKDRKVIMKTMKDHIVDLSKHEHGHCIIITLLDSVDDTVLLHKIILSEILKHAKHLAVSEWGRKVLLWLVTPANTTFFHPLFVRELIQGRESSSGKKSPEVRRKEILEYSIENLLRLVEEEPRFWLSNASLAVEMIAILKAGSGLDLGKTYNGIIKVISDLNWKIKEKDKEILGVENAGIHMALKKLAQHDKTCSSNATFGSLLVEKLDDDTLTVWLNLNRGCFLLVAIFENNSEEVQRALKSKLKAHKKVLKKSDMPGARILYKKL